MCGIAGVFNRDQSPVSNEAINRLTKDLAHRGPDGEGVWIDDARHIALGHRRLAILDLSDLGKQPMLFGDRYVIVFNGEVYNFREVRQELSKYGYHFTTGTDTEVILSAFDKWGEEALDKFNGMWAFAIYDTIHNSLFLTRDRFGVKPLYYYLSAKQIVFASEIKTLYKHLNYLPLNDVVIKDICRGGFSYHSSDQTYINEIKTLPAGHSLTVTGNAVKLSKWYHLKQIAVPQKFDDQVAEFKALFASSCQLRLRSDVPIGTCLSGGVDSGSIVGMLSTFANNPGSLYTHQAFCASFPGTPIDERSKASLLAAKLGSTLNVVDILPPSADELENALRDCDGPMHALAFYPIWKLYKYIKDQGITVTLDGQGPDEMLGGYRPLREGLIAALGKGNIGWFFDLYNTYSNQGETLQFSARKEAREVLLNLPKTLLREFVINKIRHTVSPITPAWQIPTDVDYFYKSLFKQFFINPLPAILQQYDRCSMAHGVECRMPFMDYRIVEFVFSLPAQSKVGKGFTKLILREAMRGIVPDEVLFNKQKIGFNAPIVDWLTGSLKNWIGDLLTSQEAKQNNFFNGHEIVKKFDMFQKTTTPQWNIAWQIWPAAHLIWWMRHEKHK